MKDKSRWGQENLGVPKTVTRSDTHEKRMGEKRFKKE